MSKAVVYIHGKGGSAEEAEHYVPLFPDCAVIGFDYSAQTPWEAKDEFAQYFSQLVQAYDTVTVIANSIGAYFLMQAPTHPKIGAAFFISPIVNMESLIGNMMLWAGVTEEELRRRQTIPTHFGETLSWEYLSYVRSNPIRWTLPARILYGERDTMTAYPVISDFAAETGSTLTVMPGGEHWFHTPEQMQFLDTWLKQKT